MLFCRTVVSGAAYENAHTAEASPRRVPYTGSTGSPIVPPALFVHASYLLDETKAKRRREAARARARSESADAPDIKMAEIPDDGQLSDGLASLRSWKSDLESIGGDILRLIRSLQ